jgi:CPA2 family monovalent cation:H+ antiporter-2
LLAGTIVGPHTPGFVADSSLAEQLAEIGVILLMFGVGLQFHLDELLAVKRVAIPGAVAQSLVATVLGALLALGIGWDSPAGLIFGMALSVASTVVLIRVLADNNDLHTQAGHIAVGWLVVEDHRGQSVGARRVHRDRGDTRESAHARLLEHTRSRELFTLTVLVVALGIAVGSSLVFSVSMALGAFLAGMVVGRSEYSLRAASEALPMRDPFAVLFFVSVGMLLDPSALWQEPRLVIGTTLIVLIGKPLVAFVIVWLMQYPFRTALTVSIALAQIGEFSFILATLGRELGVLPPTATIVLVAAAITSIVLNPLLYRLIEPAERWLAARPGLRSFLDRSSDVETSGTDRRPADPARRAVIVGYGPTGRSLVELLRDNNIEPTVIDLNMDNVRALRDRGIEAVYGDATRPETLVAAGVPSSGSLILGSAGMANGTEVIRLVPALKTAGADSVYSGEGEVALAFVEDILENLGATPEQIERERARVHRELTA